MKQYSAAQNPNDKKWYVIGFCGRNRNGKALWMPVSSGFKSKTEAESLIPRQRMADRDAFSCIGDSLGA